MNGYHRDAGHQGQQWMLYLLQNRFWWPEMAVHMQKVISNCKWCIQHGGTHRFHKHWHDYGVGSSIQHGGHFGFFDHFTKHVMVYGGPNYTVKTVAKFLWQGYISIFRVPVKLLSERGTNFEGNIVKELCELIGIQKVRTSPYHTQTNRQVEQVHQMPMHMVGKLSKDQKADWPKHLPEAVHTYNSMSLPITGYTSHHSMFGCW